MFYAQLDNPADYIGSWFDTRTEVNGEKELAILTHVHDTGSIVHAEFLVPTRPEVNYGFTVEDSNGFTDSARELLELRDDLDPAYNQDGSPR